MPAQLSRLELKAAAPVTRVEVTQTFLLQVILLIQRHILGLPFGAESLRNLASLALLLAELE